MVAVWTLERDAEQAPAIQRVAAIGFSMSVKDKSDTEAPLLL